MGMMRTFEGNHVLVVDPDMLAQFKERASKPRRRIGLSYCFILF
jgi:hypothetical protein